MSESASSGGRNQPVPGVGIRLIPSGEMRLVARDITGPAKQTDWRENAKLSVKTLIRLFRLRGYMYLNDLRDKYEGDIE